MWRDGPDRVIFQTCVVERDVVVISNAAVGFVSHLLQGQQPVRSSL